MNIIAIIPARMGSSRFPGKPLADIHGIPMVGHVTIRTAMCKELSSTWIATCDQVVMDYAASAGLKAVMTADTHVRCTTRTAEAMLKIEEMTGQRADIVVMVQGDEPMITPDMIDAAVEPMLKDPSINVVNLMADLATEEEFEDPNEVKVVTDLNGDALYFSREPIPPRLSAQIQRDGRVPAGNHRIRRHDAHSRTRRKGPHGPHRQADPQRRHAGGPRTRPRNDEGRRPAYQLHEVTGSWGRRNRGRREGAL